MQRPFFARFDANATWLDELRPAFDESRFFFEKEKAELVAPPPMPDLVAPVGLNLRALQSPVRRVKPEGDVAAERLVWRAVGNRNPG